jgi:hypothetical protein
MRIGRSIPVNIRRRYLKMAGQFKFLVVIADDEPLSNKFNDDRRICALTIAQTYLQQTREL